MQARVQFFTYLETHWIDCKRYRMVPPPTLLFQPPLTKVLLQMRGGDDLTIERREGVTFGTVHHELDKLKFRNPKSELKTTRKAARLRRHTDLKHERARYLRYDKSATRRGR